MNALESDILLSREEATRCRKALLLSNCALAMIEVLEPHSAAADLANARARENRECAALLEGGEESERIPTTAQVVERLTT